MKSDNKSSDIFKSELKRTFPLYFLGMIFHAIVIYILYKIFLLLVPEYYSIFKNYCLSSSCLSSPRISFC